ncbi:MAG: ABC transporter permease [Caldiserica bacterium]|nr:ABC transporter permease [Caldisericia bacterium]RLD15362.1 MAG: ABC transporter permease [Caldisericota bacterium]
MKSLNFLNEILYWWNREKERVSEFLVPIIAIIVAFLVAALMIKATGKSPWAAYKLLFQGAFGSSLKEFFSLKQAGEGLLKGAILTLTGLSVAVAFRVGLFNIGAEGQFIIGAIVAAYLGFKLNISPWIDIPIIIGAVSIISGLYAAFAGWLKITRGVHEVITTIMLNWIAIHLVENWIVVGPFNILRYNPQAVLAGTPYVKEASRLKPLFHGTRLNGSIIIAIIGVILIYILMNKTVLGYEIQATGKNPEAARYSGINTAKTMIIAMFISGALSGIGGACMILGTEGHYPGVFRPGYGFDGITMALIGGNTAIGTLLSSLFFGFVRAGATGMQLIGIHKTFADIIQGVATLFVAGQVGIKYLLFKIGEKKMVKKEA